MAKQSKHGFTGGWTPRDVLILVALIVKLFAEVNLAIGTPNQPACSAGWVEQVECHRQVSDDFSSSF